MTMNKVVLPARSGLWHVKGRDLLIKPDEAKHKASASPDFNHQGMTFFWTDQAACYRTYAMTSEGMPPVTQSDIYRLQWSGVADYMYVLEVHTTYPIDLADIRGKGLKEELAERLCGAGANCMLSEVKLAMAQHLQQQGFNGWCSLHDRGDNRHEVCLFYLPQGLVIDKCYAFGPGLC